MSEERAQYNAAPRRKRSPLQSRSLLIDLAYLWYSAQTGGNRGEAQHTLLRIAGLAESLAHDALMSEDA
jgi:hypothetical protein